jgi:prepilin-type N-terminal cleavage/methylation domain-containing protein
MKSYKRGFTLIEVMVAVMIISIVIMGLLQMYSNNTHIFSAIKKQIKTNQYVSFLVSSDDYGFENKDIYLYDLVKDFDFESDLKRELKAIKAKVIYEEIETIDLSEDSNESQNAGSSAVVLEIGRTVLQSDEFSTAFMRLKIR